MERLIEPIKDDVDDALKAMTKFDFTSVKEILDGLAITLRKIHTDGCDWCGHPHKTKDCPYRTKTGSFYMEIEYRIANDNKNRVLKQALNIIGDKKECAESLSKTSISEEIKQKLKKNAVRLELAHKELDASLEEFNLLFEEYRTNANQPTKKVEQ